MNSLNTITQLTKYTSTQLFSIAIQIIFFTSALTHLLIALLVLLRFSYAAALARTKLILLCNILLFFYFDAWGAWHNLFIIWEYLSAAIVSLYVADCCCNIANSYTTNIRGYYYLQVIAYIILTMLVPLFYVYKNQNQIIFIILLFQISLVTVLNALRNRHIVNAAIVSLTTLMVPLGRILLPHVVQSEYLNRLPIELIPIVMMAVDAEYRERQVKKKQGEELRVEGELFKSCCFFLCYSVMNGRTVYIQVILPIWFFILMLSGRDIS